jgi:hypothetical protein
MMGQTLLRWREMLAITETAAPAIDRLVSRGTSGNGGCAAAEASDVGAFGGRGSSQHDTAIETRIG